MTTTPPQRASYRPDIDGLRGIAVLAVVFYHAGFTRLFGGGFVGVDIFFVISGYLITGIIYREFQNRAFRFATFYERRVRRIVPAFAAMAAVCTAVAWLVMTSGPFKDYGASLFRAVLCTPNLYFMKNSGGYFDAPTQTLPLLHTWSLGVEEQFYLFFPTILFAALKLFRARAPHVILGLALMSLAASGFLVTRDQVFTFYMLPTRAWELLAGALLVLYPLPALSERSKTGLLVLGLAFIAMSVVLYGLLPVWAFPGPTALLPCAGTMLCIAGGTDKDRTGVAYGLLSWRPLVFVGLISYSLYLWHWPVFSLYRTAFFDPMPGVGTNAVLIVVSFALAVLSWLIVEQPIRKKWWLKTKIPLFAAALVTLTVLGTVGMNIYKQKIPPRAPTETRYTLSEDETSKLGACPARFQSMLGDRCQFFGDPDVEPSILMFGDSHAHALAETCDRLAKEQHVSGVLILYDPPFYHSYARKKEECDAYFAQLQSLLSTFRFDTALLVARFAMYTEGFLAHEMSYSHLHMFQITYDDGQGTHISDPYQALAASLRDTWSLLREHGIRRFFLLLPTPEQRHLIPETANRLAAQDKDPASLLFIPLDEHQARVGKTQGVLEHFQKECQAVSTPVTLLDPLPALCPDGQRCDAIRDGHALYFDDDHLSNYGGALLRDLLAQVFSPA